MAFNEDSRVKIPAILHLIRLGYTYIPAMSNIELRKPIFFRIFLEKVLAELIHL